MRDQRIMSALLRGACSRGGIAHIHPHAHTHTHTHAHTHTHMHTHIMASLAMSSIFAASFRSEFTAPSLFIPLTMPAIRCIACHKREGDTAKKRQRQSDRSFTRQTLQSASKVISFHASSTEGRDGSPSKCGRSFVQDEHPRQDEGQHPNNQSVPVFGVESESPSPASPCGPSCPHIRRHSVAAPGTWLLAGPLAKAAGPCENRSAKLN